jgi:hypothetical protein
MGEEQDFDFEASYWGDCTNTFDEERKQFVYAECMGLPIQGFRIMTPGLRVLDVGGGPVSMLLKAHGLKQGLVWDPLRYPAWTVDRYRIKNIGVRCAYGEDVNEQGWDEVWMYNCLQHTHDPRRIIENCLRAGRVFRIFEWIDIPPHEGHPQMLTKELLDAWTEVDGQTRQFHHHHGCHGRAYFAVVSARG